VLVEAEPNKRTGGTRVLGKADAAVRQEKSGFDSADGVFDQSFELLPLLLRVSWYPIRTAIYKCQGRSKTRPVGRSKSRPPEAKAVIPPK
jgi:hypothetical protein